MINFLFFIHCYILKEIYSISHQILLVKCATGDLSLLAKIHVIPVTDPPIPI